MGYCFTPPLRWCEQQIPSRSWATDFKETNSQSWSPLPRHLSKSPMTFALLNPMAPVWPSSYLAAVFDAVHHSFPFEIVSSLGFWFSSFLSCHFFSIPFAFSYPSPHFEGRGQDSNFGPLLVIITPLVISSSFMA